MLFYIILYTLMFIIKVFLIQIMYKRITQIIDEDSKQDEINEDYEPMTINHEILAND
jgi:capsular polysaccharide biosynthesis protein